MATNYKNRITPENITKLAEKEVFVFGSNIKGDHAGGAAKVAVAKFGAVMGQGYGLQGQSYAIPTMQGGADTIEPYVEDFIEYATKHTDLTFLVTKIGCGIAGLSVEEVAPLFYDAVDVENIHLPQEFWDYLTTHERIIKSYKGFDKDLKCRDFQYEVGKEYEMDGDISLCNRGFHACKSPLRVLDFYFLDDKAQMARFCEVEQSGTVEIERASTKIASSKIKIKAELKFSELIKLGVEWIKERTSPALLDNLTNDNGGYNAQIGSSGNCAQIGSSGDDAQIGSSGNCAQIGSSGDDARIGSSGDYARIGSSGDYAQIGSSGNDARIGSSGNYAQIGSSGYCAKIGSSGNYAQIGSSGYSAKIGSSGDDARIGSSGNDARIGSSGNYAQIGSSGNSAQIGSSGDDAQIGSSGYCAKIGSSGNYAQIGSSGDDARIVSTGEDSVICCAGLNSTVRAKKGSWITLAEWVYSKEKDRYVPKCVKTEYVDGEHIKEDTPYKLIDGKFTEVK